MTPGRSIGFGEDGRWRSGWRVGFSVLCFFAFILLMNVGLGAVIAAGHVASGEALSMEGLASAIEMPAMVLSCLAFLPMIFTLGWAIDRRGVRAFGFGPPGREAWCGVLGFAAGAVLVLIQIGAVALLGEVHRVQPEGTGPGAAAAPIGFFAFFVLQAFSEEIFSRGYMQRNLAEGVGPFLAILISSLFFSAMHALNPNQEGVRSLVMLNIFLAGVLLGLVYQRTGSLPAAWGIHLGWNYFLGPIFGIPVSGKALPGWVPLELQVQPALGGGGFGLEGGLICTVAVALSIVVFAWVTRRRSVPEGG